MDRATAISEIDKVFSAYRRLRPSDKRLLKALKDGKLYELYVLSFVIVDLVKRGFRVTFQGHTLKFKGSPGRIKRSDPHFVIVPPNPAVGRFWLFVDIEFETLGSKQISVSDNSLRHEIDIVVVSVDNGYPKNSDIILGVECKAVANFSKSILKEVLGVRRELSLLQSPTPSLLSAFGGKPSLSIPADPASEYWLAYIDPAGNSYRESPGAFGIEFKHLQP